MKLLVVTDHTFTRSGAGVHDTFCFDREFFADYRAVFDAVTVAARMTNGPPPAGSHVSSGDGVEFLDLPNVHGPRWVLLCPRIVRRRLRPELRSADAVCVRIPGLAGYQAARAARAAGRPVQFEMVGDPLEAGRADRSRVGGLGLLFARLLARQTRWIIAHAETGSYVSRDHLQRRYPPRSGATIDSISSIRLPRSSILPPRSFAGPPVPLRLICVASMLPLKDHGTLLAAVRIAVRSGLPIRLDLCGDGPTSGAVRSMIAGGLEDAVVWHGHVAGRAALFGLLDEADMFVLASLSEGMPRAMLEAMSRGLPAIGTAVGGIRELLPPEQLVPARDANAMAGLIVRAARDPAALDRFARHSHEQALQFSAEILSSRRRRLLGILRQHAGGR